MESNKRSISERFGGGARGAIVGASLAGGVAGVLYWVGTYVVPVIVSNPIYEIALAGGAVAGAVGFLKAEKRGEQA